MNDPFDREAFLRVYRQRVVDHPELSQKAIYDELAAETYGYDLSGDDSVLDAEVIQ